MYCTVLMLIVNGQFEPCSVSSFYVIKHNTVGVQLLLHILLFRSYIMLVLTYNRNLMTKHEK